MVRGLLILFAGLAAVLGAVAGMIGWTSGREARRISALPRLSAADVEPAASGREGIVEGRISEANPTLTKGFVFQFRSRFAGWRQEDEGKRATWTSVDKELPPLVLDVDGHDVRISGNYAVTFRGSDPSWVSTETLQEGVSEKYEGLRHGAPVTVVGTVASGDGGTVFQAERLVSGDFDDFLSGEESATRFGLIAAGVLFAVAMVLVVVAVTIG